MIIIGVDHSGNRRGKGENYVLSKNDWVVDAVDGVADLLKSGGWGEAAIKSISESRKMTWEREAKKLVVSMREVLSNH
jgi:hypothetical protein